MSLHMRVLYSYRFAYEFLNFEKKRLNLLDSNMLCMVLNSFTDSLIPFQCESAQSNDFFIEMNTPIIALLLNNARFKYRKFQ